ncbi:replication factor C large subunit, partial [Candidatus Micrarchaeota archaeon]|nr:replication factor C large subunit [Candidatus Micrarchaeota archaeon]
MIYTEKYSPEKIDEIIGNEQAKEKVKRWILNWRRGKMSKPLLIHGPTGVGKTVYADAVKKEFDMELIEMNASQFRDKKNVEKILSHSLLASTLSGKQKLILVDDVDFLCKNDRGGATAIVSVIKSSNAPMILTATNPWEKKIAPIRAVCEMVQVKRPTKNSIGKLLEKIADVENLEINGEKIAEIAENCGGDVRSAVNDLQANRPTRRDRETDMFNIVRTIFKAQTYKEAKEVMKRGVNYEMVALWVDENIPYEYKDCEDLADAYYYMSRADQFMGRITGSSWGYLRYVIDYISAGVALSKKKRYPYFVK